MNENDLSCVMVYSESVEAELAKNCLDVNGIRSLVTSGKDGVQLMVSSQDLERARAALGLTEEGVSAEIGEEDREEILRRAEENAAAQKEMEEIKLDQLREKAASVRSNALIGWISLAAAPAAFILIPHRPTALRASLACVAFALVQLFVWRDAKKAAEELRMKESGKV